MVSTRRECVVGMVALAANASSIAAAARAGGSNPRSLARDESFWTDIASAYSLDGRYVILNGGGNNPHPSAVTDALATFDRLASSAPRPHNYVLLARGDQEHLTLF